MQQEGGGGTGACTAEKSDLTKKNSCYTAAGGREGLDYTSSSGSSSSYKSTWGILVSMRPWACANGMYNMIFIRDALHSGACVVSAFELSSRNLSRRISSSFGAW
jgi:hypothetical protein